MNDQPLRKLIPRCHPIYGDTFMSLSDDDVVQEGDHTGTASTLLSLEGDAWLPVPDSMVGLRVHDLCEHEGDVDGGERLLRRLNMGPTVSHGIDTAVGDVLGERIRQIASEGWTPAHDDQHVAGELAQASAWYACDAREAPCWPWVDSVPDLRGKDRRRQVVIAAALLLAEIERLDRLAAKEGGE